MRDVGIIDCYRHKLGVRLGNAYPVIVTFKARREKEQILWRAKDKLRKKAIYVTEDSQARLSERLRAQKEKEKDMERRGAGKPLKKSQSINFDSLPSPTKWPANTAGSLAGSPKKMAGNLKNPASGPPVPGQAMLKNLQSKSLSKLELEDLFDML